MADTKYSPTDTKEQALKIKEAWTNIGPTSTYGDMTLDEYLAALTAFQDIEAHISGLEDQLTSARNKIVDVRYALWDKVKRARNGAKSKHGDDSDEFERFGGTRMSERNKPRADKPEEPSPAA